MSTSHAQKMQFKSLLEQAIGHADTVELEMYAGMKNVGKDTATSAEFEPDGTKTIVVKINGGANNVRIERVETEADEKIREDDEA